MIRLYDYIVRRMATHTPGCCGCYIGCAVFVVAPLAAAAGAAVWLLV